MIIVSACLAGVKCRYDGQGVENERVVELVRSGEALPVCPEQLGGLPTPRPCCEIRDGGVFSVHGVDVTGNFLRGAQEALRIAELCKAEKAILKSFSPSCGCGEIYDGSFSGKRVEGDGLFAIMLKEKGIRVESI